MADTDDDIDTLDQPDQLDQQDQLEEQQAQPVSFRQTGPGVYSPYPAPTPAPQQAIPTLGSRRPKFDPRTAEPDPNATPIVFAPDTPAEPVAGKDTSFARDLGRSALNDMRGWGQDLLGVGNYLNNQLLGNQTIRDKIADLTKSWGDDIEDSVKAMSPTRQSAARASILRLFNIGPDTDEQGNKIPSPFDAGVGGFADYAVQRLVSLGAPIAAISMLPEGIAAAATSAVVFGAASLGQVYNGIVKAVADKPDAEYRKESEPYDQLRASGMSEAEAKTKMVSGSAASIFAPLIGAAGGAVGGAGLGRIFGEGAAAATRGALATRAIGAGEAGAAMGIQSAGTNVGTQVGQIGAGTQKDFDVEALAREVAMGTLGGAVMGGLFAGKRAPKAAETEPPPGPGDIDERAAITAAIPPDEPPGGGGGAAAPATTGPRGTQGEMFPAQGEMFPGQGQMGPPGGPPRAPITGMQPGMAPGATQGDLLAPTTRVSQAQPVQGEMFPRPAPAAAPPAEPPAAPPSTPPAGGAGGAPPPVPPQAAGGGVAPLPAAARTAVDTSQARAPAPAPTAAQPLSRGQVPLKDWPSQRIAGGDVAQMRDELQSRFGYKPAVTSKMSDNAVSTAYDQRVWAEEARQPPSTPITPVTTVVAGEPRTGVPAAAEPKGEAASPSSPAVVGSLPEAAGAALAPHQQDGLRAIDAAQSAIKVPKGTPVEALVNQAFEHARQIMREAPTEADAVVQLRTRLGESKGRVREAYGRVIKEYTGESLRAKPESETAPPAEATKTIEIEGKQVPVKVYAEGERGVTEAEQIKPKPKESMRAEDIEQRMTTTPEPELEPEGGGAGKGAGEETSAGLTMGLEPVEKVRAETTTDRERIFNDRLEDVRSGKLTPMEAAIAYDERKGVGGIGGRKRREALKDFATALRDRIAKAEDTTHQDNIIKEMTRVNEDPHLDGRTKRAQLDKLRKQLDAETGPEVAEELRGYLERIEDPVGHEARGTGQGPLQQRAPVTPSGISPRSSRFVGLSHDQRFNTNLEHYIRTSEEHDVPVTGKDVARQIMQDPLVGAEMQPFRALAARYRELAPDVPVYSPQRAYELGHINADQLGEFERGESYGHYDPSPGNQHIVLNLEPRKFATSVETALHELSHAITAGHIDNLINNDRNHPHLQALRAIGEELAEHFEAEKNNLTDDEKFVAEAIRAFGIDVHAPHELNTMLLTNPTLQGFAASRVASPKLRSTLARLGLAPREQGQSIWRSYTDWVRRVLGLRSPASASEHTLLDHILRTAHDVTEAGARYNEKLLPRDPVLHQAAQPLYQAAGASLSARSRDVLDRIDPRGVGERFRSFLLQSMPGDHIVSRYQRLSGGFARGLNAWRDSINAIARSSKVFVDENYDKTREYTRAYNRLSDKQDLGRLMTDATLGEVRLGPGADNSHLSAEQQPLLRELQGRYDSLTPQAKDLYGNVRDLYSAWYKQDRSAQLERWMRQFMPDATPAEKTALRTAAQTRGSLGNFVSNMANAPSARDVAKLHLLGFVNGDYFPLRRFGNYVVQYGDRDVPGSYGVEFFERRSQANARRKELLQQNVADVHQVGLKRTYASGELAPHHPFIDEMINRLGEQGYDQHERQEIRDQINSVLMMHATAAERSRASQSYRRRGIQGASTDQGRVLAQEFLSMQGRIGHLEHGDERSVALKDLREEVRQLERSDAATPDQAVQAAQVVRELDKRTATLEDLDNPVQAAMQKANAWSFAQSLMSPSHMLTSALEAHSNAASLLGARYGYIKTGVALSKALAQIGPRTLGKGAMNTLNAVRGELKQKDWNILEVMKQRLIDSGASRPGMERLVKLLVDNGLIDHTALQDMRLQAHAGLTGGGAGTAWNWFTNLNAAGAHSVDAMNKLAVAKAAFDLEFKNSGDWRKAADMAVDFARQAMPNYQLKARISSQKGMLGPFGAPLMQFKNYGLHELSVLANLTRDAMDRSSSRQERWIAAKGLAGILASRAMLAGVLTLTADATRYIGGAYDLLTGADKPHNYQNNIRNFLTDSMGPELGELVARGLPHALGIDLHRRVGLENLLEIPEMTSFGKEGAGEVLLGLATGATGENLEASFGGFTKLIQGDMSGLLGIVPRPIRDAMKGYELSQQGVIDSRGKTILAPEKLSAGAPLAQTLGFQPAGVSEFREGRNAVLEAEQEAKAERTHLTNRFLEADPADRPAVWSQIQHDYNADPSHHGMTITYDQLMKDLHERRKQIKAPFGLRLPAKATATLSQAGRFANVP